MSENPNQQLAWIAWAVSSPLPAALRGTQPPNTANSTPLSFLQSCLKARSLLLKNGGSTIWQQMLFATRMSHTNYQWQKKLTSARETVQHAACSALSQPGFDLQHARSTARSEPWVQRQESSLSTTGAHSLSKQWKKAKLHKKLASAKQWPVSFTLLLCCFTIM